MMGGNRKQLTSLGFWWGGRGRSHRPIRVIVFFEHDGLLYTHIQLPCLWAILYHSLTITAHFLVTLFVISAPGRVTRARRATLSPEKGLYKGTFIENKLILATFFQKVVTYS